MKILINENHYSNSVAMRFYFGILKLEPYMVKCNNDDVFMRWYE